MSASAHVCMFNFIQLDFLDASDEDEENTYVLDYSQIVQPKVLLDKLPFDEGNMHININVLELPQSDVLTGN